MMAMSIRTAIVSAGTGIRGVFFGVRARHLSVVSGAVVVGIVLWLAPSAGAQPNIAVAWGANFEGQLGDGSRVLADGLEAGQSYLPVPVSGLSGVTAVAAGGEQGLALLENETLAAWGANWSGQLGNGSTVGSDVPVAVSGVKDVTVIAAGYEHSLACGEVLHACSGKGKAMAWGSNVSGQLGDKSYEESEVPVAAKGLPADSLKAIAAGGEDSLALCYHLVYSWGNDEEGQLGDGVYKESSDEARLVEGVGGIKYLNEVVAIAAGREDNLALLENGTVVAWGANGYGELGDGNTSNSDVPVAVTGLKEVVGVAAGGEHNLALLKNGTVMAWGSNFSGQLGDGNEEQLYSDVPVAVSGLKEVTAIAAGGEHSLALLKNGTVMSWGDNQQGQLGNGEEAIEETFLPGPVKGLAGVKGISAGEEYSLAFGAPPATPAVTSISPSEGSEAGGSVVTLTGSNLTLASAVRFGSRTARDFTVNSEGSITAVAPAGTGEVNVTVTTPGGTSPTSPGNAFSYGAG
jgi:alpha-tubulin suppressor-like RCC1 family protein